MSPLRILGGCALALAALLMLATPAALAAEGGAYTVSHAMGATRIEGTPQRVVTLGQGATEAALALGVTPVGAVRSWGHDPWYDRIAERMADATVVGAENQPELETIARLQPDLILGSQTRHEAIYGQLTGIAPTVFAEKIAAHWKPNFTLYARAMNRADRGKALLAEWDARVARFQERMQGRLDTEVSIVRFGGGQVRIYVTGFPGSVIREVGLQRPPAQQVDDWDTAPSIARLTLEQIPRMDGDVMFVMTSDWWSGPEGGSDLEATWRDHPLWQTLDVAESGNIHHVNEVDWNLGGGLLSAHRMLDDLNAFFLEE